MTRSPYILYAAIVIAIALIGTAWLLILGRWLLALVRHLRWRWKVRRDRRGGDLLAELARRRS